MLSSIMVTLTYFHNSGNLCLVTCSLRWEVIQTPSFLAHRCLPLAKQSPVCQIMLFKLYRHLSPRITFMLLFGFRPSWYPLKRKNYLLFVIDLTVNKMWPSDWNACSSISDHYFYSWWKSIWYFSPNICKDAQLALKNVESSYKIVISSSDAANFTGVLDVISYSSKLNLLFQDEKYSPIFWGPTSKIERKMSSHLNLDYSQLSLKKSH